MLTREDLYPYQKTAVNHILANNGSMLWLDIGLGKTISSLTAINDLLQSFTVSSALVVAPVKVVEAVWKQEAKKWEHTKWMRFSLLRGTPKQRLEQLLSRAHVYLVNYEQLPWLVKTLQDHWIERGLRLPFDMVVFDEISKMKMATAKRSKAFAKILQYFKYRVGLTGTPAANGIIDLHGQFLMVDGGKRLGPNITFYRNRWFIHNPFAHKWTPRRGATKDIQNAISDITLEMKSEDYLDLPPVIDQDIMITLPEKIRDQYKKFENEFFLELENGGEVEAFNAGAKSTKCRQLANGAVYTTDTRDVWESFHDEKIDTVCNIVEELGDKPVLICYQFRHDIARLKERFPEAVVLDRMNIAEKVEAWNSGEIKMLIGHPMSMGHGLNLQYGGNHIIWFGLPWSLELYDQAIGRLCRNGQEGNVVVNHRILAEGTIEKAILRALDSKTKTQNDLREAVKKYHAGV